MTQGREGGLRPQSVILTFLGDHVFKLGGNVDFMVAPHVAEALRFAYVRKEAR